MAPPRLVVTLLHGTFASKATWVEAGGSIGRALSERFGDRVALASIRWSGANTHRGRIEGAALLREHVLQERSGFEGASHVVVAHSHAGNVVAYAARDEAVDARLAGVVTLATPFIVARPRNLGHVGLVVGQAMVVWIVVALWWLLARWLGPLLGGSADAGLSPGYQIALIAALVIAVEAPALFAVGAMRRASSRLLGELRLAEIDDGRLLVLRAMADEATAVITFLQLPSVIATFAFGRLAAFTDAVVERGAGLARSPFKAIGVLLLLFFLSLLPAFVAIWLTGSTVVMYVVLISFMGLAWGPIVFALLRNRHLATVAAAIPVALVFAPVLLLTAVAAGLAYGWRFALAIAHLDVVVEATPIGRHGVTLLSPAAAGNLDTPGSLLHSTLYDDARAIELIVDFIAGKLGEAPPRD